MGRLILFLFFDNDDDVAVAVAVAVGGSSKVAAVAFTEQQQAAFFFSFHFHLLVGFWLLPACWLLVWFGGMPQTLISPLLSYFFQVFVGEKRNMIP